MKLLKLVLVSTVLFLLFPATAQARTTVTGGPYTNLQLTGQVVSLKLSAYPTNAGFYILQCLKSNDNARPHLCNPSAQLWVSTSAGANFAPSADILFRPSGKFTFGTTNVDCTKTSCGIFIRLDHTASADRSEDQFIPITFVGGATPTTTADVIRAYVGRRALEGDEALTVRYQETFTITATSRSGAPLTFSTTSTGCYVSGNQVTVTKGFGYCDVTISSPGSGQYSAATKHYSFRLKPALQKVVVGTNVRAGTSLVLPATTNLGAKVTYDVSNTANCILTTNQNLFTLAFNKVGDCRVVATAPAMTDMYYALKQTLSFKIR